MKENNKRRSGILLHPTSLPGRFGIGDFGTEAYEFIDFMKKAGQTIWQVLPFGHTGFGDSPYQAFSAFAGQPLLISPQKLYEDCILDAGDLDEYPDINLYAVEYGEVIIAKTRLLKKAYNNFMSGRADVSRAAVDAKLEAEFYAELEEKIKQELDDPALNEKCGDAADLIKKASSYVPKEWSVSKKGFAKFCKKEAYWLDDYALFMAGKDYNEGRCWLEWECDLRDGDEKVKKAWTEKLSEEIGYYKFIQYVFDVQWSELRKYANDNGIKIVGDIPIFVSMDSTDVWADRKLFLLEDDGYPTVVAGVPPDYFSATGQLWGNPLYDWKAHEKEKFAWWIKRVEKQLELFDIIRIDHFRGFEAYYAIPYGEETAVNGKWVPSPGVELFNAFKKHFGDELPVWAEDLGVITPPVEELRDSNNLPGMKILQFAFDDERDNDSLPHHFTTDNCICYTGTHDNSTIVGWYYEEANENQKDRLRRYTNSDGGRIHMDLIRVAMASIARYTIFPIQDILGFGNDCRMNTPSTPSGNWSFRYRRECLTDELARELYMMTDLFGRLPDKE
ncbi:MAG: 4-alpha-glucanotransferase [Lachnospiraceae bacterium]|nr:4-alpha-glucanotransferase [Lachnospiraceae bacterium]